MHALGKSEECAEGVDSVPQAVSVRKKVAITRSVSF